MHRPNLLLILTILIFAACGQEAPTGTASDGVESKPAAEDSTVAESAETSPPVNPSTGELLPVPFSVIWTPALVGYDEMIERRIIRIVVPYGGYQFYYDDGQPKGAIYELVQRFENYLNQELGTGNVKVYVVIIPVSRHELLAALEKGHADIVAADLTITEDRARQFSFSRPLLAGIDEVVVTGPQAPPIERLEDLAGVEVFVRESSSYFEHLLRIGAEFEQQGLAPPKISRADDLLEAEDILEMVNAGLVNVTIVDDYKAEFWSKVFPDITVRDDLIINEGGEIAWVTRADTPKLMEVVNQFLRKYGKGTLVGNDTYNRYLADASRVRCAHRSDVSERVQEMADLFQTYGERYDFDWLMLAAQGFQESGLRQNRRSPAGAVGVMQIKPSTAADRNVGIDDVSMVENNIHAGAKYMRFLADRYFSDEGVDDLNQWLLSLAAYNAGPARVASMRREAEKGGYDPDRWFDNVEVIAAQKIGRETVTYVSNIFKYYVGYQIINQRQDLRDQRHGDTLGECI
jgi:membrane-bound lytic murein transglycosylase MltF